MAIDNFPLSWPEGWPRKTKRMRARFAKGAGNMLSPSRQLSVADGVQRCLTVLQRMDVPDWNVIVSTNMPVRNDGLPRSGVAEPKDPGAAVYFQKRNSAEKDRKVMAIDQYDRVADNLAAIAATLEAMRAIERYGGAQILERAFTGFIALPSPEVARPWWTVLGIDPQSDRAEIELAYKRKRSTAHADKGGSDAEFLAVQQAYEQALAEVRL